MNPLNSVIGTIVSGFILAAVIIFALGSGQLNMMELIVWFHVLAGVVWIGLLYYFNFVQVPGVGKALSEANNGGPGPAAINKYIAPTALAWFRWGALATWITGFAALEKWGITSQALSFEGFTFESNTSIMGIGAWLGTIMLFNVWGLIWPNQKKILGMKEATAEEIAGAKKIALIASRTNTLLSIPMLLCMTAYTHNLPY